MIGTNPYQPSPTPSNHWDWWRLFLVLSLPAPTRRGRARKLPYIWLFDSFVATILCFVGGTIAEYINVIFTAVIGIDMYGTTLLIGWFPLGMWMHYCRVGFANWTYRRTTALIVVLFLFGELQQIDGSWIRIPFGLAVLAIALPLERMLGTIVFSLLPGSRPSKTRQNNGMNKSRVGSSTLLK